jgi:hypothetical protein
MKIMQVKDGWKNVEGRVAVPLLMWVMGVPGFLVILLWFFFFRGH